MIVVKPSVEFYVFEPISITGDWIEPVEMIERVARTCYKSEDKIVPGSASKMVARLKRMGHHAMLEFAEFAFKWVCDRGVSHELVRHRLCSFAQESTRYCDYGKDGIRVIEPHDRDGNSMLGDSTRLGWEEACWNAEEAYQYLIDKGHPPQVARAVLPICVKTEVWCKANARQMMHIQSLRNSKKAHPHIAYLAELTRKRLVEVLPELFGDAE
jgi:thymidylate synthase (FAD)